MFHSRKFLATQVVSLHLFNKVAKATVIRCRNLITRNERFKRVGKRNNKKCFFQTLVGKDVARVVMDKLY